MSQEEFQEAKQEIVDELAECEQTFAEALAALEELPSRISRLRGQLAELAREEIGCQ